MFRLGEVCSHVSAILFKVESRGRELSKAACTSLECEWNASCIKKAKYSLSTLFTTEWTPVGINFKGELCTLKYTNQVTVTLDQFKPPKSILKMAAMTLRWMSRSNCSYGTKVLVRTIIRPIKNCCQKPLNVRHIFFPLEYIANVNFDL